MAAPTSTYRLQFGPHLRLTDAGPVADYLAALGVGALYASPLLASSPASTHGYDMVDPSRTCDERGGEDARSDLVARLRRAGLGFVVDVVCNHMGVADAAANPWWWDVLRHGPDSAYARFFDIDWSAGPLLLPVLADDGEGDGPALAQITTDGTTLRYHEHRFPLAPGTGDGTVREIHDRQHYRLVSWRRGMAELTYRRFFNIDTLAGLRTEDPQVFAAVHEEVLRWVRSGEVTGLRIDHPDGLADPGGYLRRLRRAAPDTWIVVEKVVGVDEPLPISWPVDGTTGYDALRQVCGVFVDPAGRRWFESEQPVDPVEVAADSRRQVALTLLPAEVRRVAALVGALLPGRDPRQCHDAVVELLTAFPVYRTYLPEQRRALEQAVAIARRRRPDLAGIVAAVRDEMVARPGGELAIRMQQTTGAVMAKGVEDTAFYRYHRLIALNEVGGDLTRFAVSPEEFHTANSARQSAWPGTMTTLSTHDTKRSEDVRARLAVLSEMADEFLALARRWAARCPVGDPALEPLAWQTLVGAWPIEPRRLSDFLLKAAREARQRTSWTQPDHALEKVLTDWPQRVGADPELSAEVAAFVDRIREPGWSNSLGQKLLQLAGPGVPDVYQGTELWDWSLVDPDNRRAVDFAARRALLDRLDGGWRPEVDETAAVKLLVVSRVLRLRRDRPELWDGYVPVRAEGPAAGHLVGFARGRRREVVAVATRLPMTLAATGWSQTLLPLPAGTGRWTDVISGERVETSTPRVADLLRRYPVALLIRGER
ncbi:malto-oligosyltrehalose synthase [Solwaraspora sp. WMMD937]|uniref:malto-oligosyltrehalose synthase n=1 Tax=Solwaraspora sp. WMMD937 TaxID=3016090 RepID=UPI002499DEEE|nr:malto-oligosyltrehalose synthase [Solwaraspora sp. WMMD937]WFE20063.1 malto-oligosyltrehalose synthase [Solwaraspora sp. WMMD937]